MQAHEVDIGVADKSDIDGLSNLLGDVFSRRDPPAVVSGFSKTKLIETASIFAEKSVSEGLSIVVKDKADGSIIAGTLAHDFANPPPSEIEKIDLGTEPVIALLDELEESFQSRNVIRPGRFLHIFMIAVDDRMSGRGIAQTMVGQCLNNAARIGFDVAFTEATNRISQKIFLKLGFIETGRVTYKDFHHKGSRPFEGIKVEGGCALMEKSLVP